MKRDRIAEFFREQTPRRILALALFLGLIVLFRKLFVLLAFFVMFERALFFSSGFLSRRFKWGRGLALGAVLSTSTLVLGLTVWLSAGRVARWVTETRDTLPSRMAAVREHPWYLALHGYLPDSEKLAQAGEHYAAGIAHTAAELGHFALYAVIGLVLAIVFFLDEEKIRAFRGTLSEGTIAGTLARWFEHVAEAVSLTLQLQLIVAACNAVLTLPVLLVIGVPHVPALMALIFVSGLIPVVGNLISGAVLVVLSYQVKGWFGVGLFVGLTFVLHKIESYYLNPRLTARHVALPGFVLILSLIAWEHLLGFVGLFVSFPFLYVAGKIRQELVDENAAAVASATPPAPPAVAEPPAVQPSPAPAEAQVAGTKVA
ncbi:MAG TPA: AI-2E family transporter [Myxococcaceae bacterium]|nr:AI-2E family transporter [Myxococcaceae bacterium]